MSRPLRVLMVEDSPTDAKLVQKELARHFELDVERVDTAEAMLAALKRRGWDLVLSDYSMPRFSAAAALATLKSTGIDLPFLIVSGTIGEGATADSMRAGAHDVILKDTLARLAPAIERELREAAERAERRRAEEALRRSEARYRRLTESGIIGVAIADVHGAVQEANQAYLDLVGYAREDVSAGRVRWTDLTAPEFRRVGQRASEELGAKGIAHPWETEVVRRDGSRVACLVGVAMLDPPTCIAFTADLTERKRAEVGQRQAEDALRHIEAQLRQAQKMEAVGRLAGGVAHDFNNVLSVVLSYAEIIHDELRPLDPMRADVLEIKKAGARAAALTRQLLAFSRQQPFEARVIDLGELLASTEGMLRRLVGEDVDLALRTPAPGPRVFADPTGIEQVLMNLVVNARDAMPTGGRLTIEVQSVDLGEPYASAHLAVKPGPHVMLAVTDTGSGMDRETQSRIFEPFFTTKEMGKGTGLGLSTVFGIVQQAGGSVFVYSELGAGTTFKIYLPRVEAMVEVARPSTQAANLRGTEVLLLVEDEEQVRAIATTVLRRQGYVVLVAKSAGEALLASERHEGAIDLLLTDVVMPEMSGPELAKRLCAARPSIKVLCMSGYTDDSVVRHGVLAAEMAFLQKPFTPTSLAQRVRQVLDAV